MSLVELHPVYPPLSLTFGVQNIILNTLLITKGFILRLFYGCMQESQLTYARWATVSSPEQLCLLQYTSEQRKVYY